jgi:transposase
MDTELVTEQFEVSQRRVQQLVEEYRDSGEDGAPRPAELINEQHHVVCQRQRDI